MSGWSILVAMAFVAACVDARADGDADLRATLEEVRARHDVPALWAGRFHADGRRVFAVSGVRKHGEAEPARLDDLVHIGSCTKAMTAAMVAQRCSRDTLRFETTLAEIFPLVRNGEGKPITASAWGAVTVGELLRHTSGAPANADWWALHRAHPDDPVAARRALLEWLLTQERPAETGFLYSNVGYALLGHVIESIDRKAWETLIDADVFESLGITSAGFGALPPQGGDGAFGHVVRGGVTQPVRIDNPPPLGPAGRVHLTIGDWARFALVFTGSQEAPERERLGISPRDWAGLLTAPDGEHYAGGWGLHDRVWGGGNVLSHSGSNTTWTCVAWVAPNRDFCLIAATNIGAPAAAKACDEGVAACLDPRILPFVPAAELR